MSKHPKMRQGLDNWPPRAKNWPPKKKPTSRSNPHLPSAPMAASNPRAGSAPRNQSNPNDRSAGKNYWINPRYATPEDEATVLYFAYGSNLSERAMQFRCPGAVKVKALTLIGAKLVFRGAADIEVTDDPNDTIEGGVWQITKKHERTLDSYEGASRRNPDVGSYRRTFFELGEGADAKEVLVYKMNDTGVAPPSGRYYDLIVEGYGDFGLDVAKLVQALEQSWINKAHSERTRKRYARTKPKLARISNDTVVMPNCAQSSGLAPEPDELDAWEIDLPHDGAWAWGDSTDMGLRGG